MSCIFYTLIVLFDIYVLTSIYPDKLENPTVLNVKSSAKYLFYPDVFPKLILDNDIAAFDAILELVIV